MVIVFSYCDDEACLEKDDFQCLFRGDLTLKGRCQSIDEMNMEEIHD